MTARAEPWIDVVGIGAEGVDSLSATARAVVEAGEVLVGGERHLAMLPDHHGERVAWERPLETTLDLLAAYHGRRVVVLATGDPMCFGVGETLVRRFGADQLRVLPAPSVFSLVCARLGWSLQTVSTLSLHGRPAAALRRHLLPGAQTIILSHDGDTPGQIAQILTSEGFGPSPIWIFENLGRADERVNAGTAEAWPRTSFASLNTVAIECRPQPEGVVRPLVPGLPDDSFESDGLLTKREVRAASLAKLAPCPGQRLWDVGAGSGAIAIEWLRAAPGTAALAIERDPTRCGRIARNAERLGTPELEVMEGEAPRCLDRLPPPDAVFVGGGLEHTELLACCWQALASGGRLVANAVTLNGERTLLDWHDRNGGSLARLEVSRLDRIGHHRAWQPARPVTQLAVFKP
jgi:precorrin-6Y C5,15-methyltransferase (decarboxylating)